MRKNLLALLLVLVVGGSIYLWMLANRTFKWIPDYEHLSDEPFGCELFDSIASATMPNGYAYWEESLDSLMHLPGPKSLLIINDKWSWDSVAFQRLDSCAKAGSKVLLVLSNSNYLVEEAWDFKIGNYYLDTDLLSQSLKGKVPPDTLEWVGNSPVQVTVSQGLHGSILQHGSGKRFRVTAYLHSQSLWDNPKDMNRIDEEQMESYDKMKEPAEDDSYDRKRGSNDDNQHISSYQHSLRKPISMERKMGKGWLYLASTSLFFTNYGVLDRHISVYLNRQLSQLADYPTYRVPASLFEIKYSGANDSGHFTLSPLSFMLSQKALRWALYTILAAILLFMVFTARRRQRVIPVIERPVNRNLEFVRLLGTIYYRRHDNVDLLRKKYTYFKDEVRRRMMMDLDDIRYDEQNAHLLALRTSVDEQDVLKLLHELRDITSLSTGDISAVDLRRYIDEIENISKHL